MSLSLFNPFATLHFESSTCFLTGNDIDPVSDEVTVFPEWILDRFSLREKKFKMMDQVSQIRYGDLKLPCSPEVKNAFEILDTEVRNAFDSGYEAVKNIAGERLFQWIGRIVYGIIYHEADLERQRTGRRPGKEFKMSSPLREKFGKFHLMLQSLIAPTEFSGVKPWSMEVVKLKYSKDTFNYKDEPTNLNFSLGMNGFGIIACLQDNGAVANKQRNILDIIGEKVLHPIQFEELAARFLYSNYLLKKHPQHNIQISGDKLIIESFPLTETVAEPLFNTWSDDMFSQVLAGYWEPWGFEKKSIYNFPDSPLSFLENDFTHEFVEPESVSLPF